MSNNGKPTALQTEGELATSAFESFLTPQEEEKVEEAVTNEVEEEVIEEDELPEAAELEEEMVEDEESDFDDEIDDEEQTEVEDEQEQPTYYKVRIDGEEVEVTLEELQSGYSRQQDYTRKTQELSEQRKNVDKQQEELAKRDAIYSQLLPRLEAQLKGEPLKLNSADLKKKMQKNSKSKLHKWCKKVSKSYLNSYQNGKILKLQQRIS